MLAVQGLKAFRTVIWLGLALICIFQAAHSHALGSLNLGRPGANFGGYKSVTGQTIETFERLLGHPLKSDDLALIADVTQQAQDYTERPQNVAYIGRGVEFLFMVCVQGKINGPSKLVGAGFEITPCVEIPSGRSYVMNGLSVGAAAQASANLVAALYFGPSSLERPIIGEYAFFNWTQQVHPLFNLQGQVSISTPCVGDKGEEYVLGLIKTLGWNLASQGCQVLVMGGVGIDLLGVFKESFKKAQKLLKDPMRRDQKIPFDSKGDWRGGVIFKIVEFPWWDRIYNQGMYDPNKVFEGLKGATLGIPPR